MDNTDGFLYRYLTFCHLRHFCIPTALNLRRLQCQSYICCLNYEFFGQKLLGDAQSISSGASGFFFTIHGHFPGESVFVSLVDIPVCPKLVEVCINRRMEDTAQLETVYNDRFVLSELTSNKMRDQALENVNTQKCHAAH